MSPRKILSFGCSFGEEISTLLDVFPSAEEIVGVEINDCARQKATETFADNPRVKISKYLGEETGFDLIISFNVLCMFPQPTLVYKWEKFETAIRTFFSALNEGGIMAIYGANYSAEEAMQIVETDPSKFAVIKTRINRGQVPMFSKDGRLLLESENTFRYIRKRVQNEGSSTDFFFKRKRVSIGILGYSSSNNVGDYIQSMAQINQWAVFYTPEWNIKCPTLRKVFEYFSSLKFGDKTDRWKCRQRSYDTIVTVLWIDRDTISQFPRPAEDSPVWIIMNGWFMHKRANTYLWPPPEWIRPIFVSFHCQKEDFLDEKCVKYLQKYSPIGCRDVNTVRLLREKNIECFFSSCLTTTLESSSVNTLKTGKYAVDIKDNEWFETKHTIPNFNKLEFSDCLEVTFNFFLQYSTAEKIKTLRLHAFLPCLAAGVEEVKFTSPYETTVGSWLNRSRFEGLVHIASNDEEREWRALLMTNRLVETIDRLLVCQLDDAEVYRTWALRSANSCTFIPASENFYLGRVLNDKWRSFRCSAPAVVYGIDTYQPELSLCMNVSYTSESTHHIPYKFIIRSVPLRPFERQGTILITFDENFAEIAPTALRSLSASNPTILWNVYCIIRDVSETSFNIFKQHVARLHNIVIHERAISYIFNKYHTHLHHVSVSCMDRLFIDDVGYVNPETNRVIYLDLDILVFKSIEYLLDIETGFKGICARSSLKNNVRAWLEREKEENIPLDYTYTKSFNAGIFVADIKVLRANQYRDFVLDLAGEHGINDQIILNLYCKSQYMELPAIYNKFVGQEILPPEGYVIAHFVGSKKPWLYESEWTGAWNFYSKEECKVIKG